MAFALDSKVKPARDVLFKEIEGEAVLLNLNTGLYFGLNEAGTRIWKIAEKERRLDRVLQGLTEEFEIEPRACEKDLMALAQELLKHGLWELAG